MIKRHLLVAGILLAGTIVGLMLALPVPDIAGKCPPQQEGLLKCVVDKQVLPTVTKILLGIAAVYIAFEIGAALPGVWRRWRAGDLFGRIVGANPPWEADPVLVASVWGETYEDAAAAKGGLHRVRVVRKLRDRRQQRGLPDMPLPEQQPDPERETRVAAVALLLQELDALGATRR